MSAAMETKSQHIIQKIHAKTKRAKYPGGDGIPMIIVDLHDDLMTIGMRFWLVELEPLFNAFIKCECSGSDFFIQIHRMRAN